MNRYGFRMPRWSDASVDNVPFSGARQTFPGVKLIIAKNTSPSEKTSTDLSYLVAANSSGAMNKGVPAAVVNIAVFAGSAASEIFERPIL